MAVELLEMVSNDIRVYYNTLTGEHDIDGDFMEHSSEDEDKYEGAEWIRGPRQYEIRGYAMMEDFIESVVGSSQIRHAGCCHTREGRIPAF
ncbi:hypothetical protein FACS1894184_09120 [Clostridia bacterium]|nr:hypothetical protein FACS1894184_09120 [Clostridia bacterium]